MTASGMPAWWNERRLGIFVHATLATVPAWAPIGQYAEWYRSHLGEPVEDVLLHPHPMPEVLAHHRDRWGHVERYDDFAELLTFDRFDAEAWASLVREAGAGYTVFVAKHHDGWAWWDAPGSTRRLTEVGPKRNVLAEYAAACERNDIVFGTYLSLLDWGDERYPGDDYVESALHPQAVDLVERYGSSVLWGDGHWGHDAATWRTDELLDRVRSVDPNVIVNDRWHASPAPDGAPPILRTFEYDTPDGIVDGPWELTRGLGASFGHNRAEGPEHHLGADEIIGLYTEVLAKGGHLLLNVGPAADGTIPDLQAQPLREAGAWIRRHAGLVARSRPWNTWGDEEVRYLDVDDGLVVVDVAGRGRFAALSSDDYEVTDVSPVGESGGAPGPTWLESPQGLQIERVGAPIEPGPAVYTVRARHRADRARLFTLDSPGEIELQPLLDGVVSGDIVQLGDGRYRGPATVPAGVVLRGLGGGRTTIVHAAPSGIAPGPPTVALRRNARVEHVRVEGAGDSTTWWRQPPVVSLDGPSTTVLGCDVAGSISVVADDAVVRATRVRRVVATGADRLLVSRCTLRGNRWDVGVDVSGGTGHEVESCDLAAHLCGVRFTETIDSVVRGNHISSRWWAVHARRTERVHVHGNHVEDTMRAVDIDGGSGACVDGNAVMNGDSGCLVQAGAADVIVAGNHWQGCRAGLITWSADPLHRENVGVGLLDPDAAHVSGP